MTIYLKNKETNEVINTYTNVIRWSVDFVEYSTNGYRGKTYCNTETEYFTDEYTEEENISEEIDN